MLLADKPWILSDHGRSQLRCLCNTSGFQTIETLCHSFSSVTSGPTAAKAEGGFCKREGSADVVIPPGYEIDRRLPRPNSTSVGEQQQQLPASGKLSSSAVQSPHQPCQRGSAPRALALAPTQDRLLCGLDTGARAGYTKCASSVRRETRWRALGPNLELPGTCTSPPRPAHPTHTTQGLPTTASNMTHPHCCLAGRTLCKYFLANYSSTELSRTLN